MMDWLAKIVGLPEIFLHSHEGKGGGIIQGSASDSILVAVLAAREIAVKRLTELHPELTESDIRGRLIGYSSDQSNSAIEKSGLLGAVPIRLLKANENGCLTGDILKKALNEDLTTGKFPVICIATLGTTGTCAFDNISSIAPICNANNIWLHIDAAYAGAAFCCPELRKEMDSVELVDSYNFNLHKWMNVNFDCSAMYLKNADSVEDSFTVDRIYLQHKYQNKSKIPDFRHWQIALGRKFRALKVWITLRTLGVENIRAKIRRDVGLAKYFENLLKQDSRFEIVTGATLGLLSFCIKNNESLTKQLLENLTSKKQIFMIPATAKGKYMIRFAICGVDSQETDMDFAFNEIVKEVDQLFENSQSSIKSDVDKIKDKFTTDLNISKPISEKVK